MIEYNSSFELILTGNMGGSFEVLTKKLGIYTRVSWVGWLEDNDLPSFYKKLDVFVIPSTQEGLNIAGLQAMATAVPVVSTYCGGPEDYVIHDKTGSLVSSNAEEMSSAILNIT